MNKDKSAKKHVTAAEMAEKMDASEALKVSEPHVEYDPEEFDDRLISKMRAHATICRAKGTLVEGLFRSRTRLLNFDEIEAAADEMSRAGAEMRRMIQYAKTGAA